MRTARELSAVAVMAALLACGTVPGVGETLSGAGHFAPVATLRDQVSFDHQCPPERVRVLRKDAYDTTVDLDVCGAVRRYAKATEGDAWRDVTSAYPPDALPRPWSGGR